MEFPFLSSNSRNYSTMNVLLEANWGRLHWTYEAKLNFYWQQVEIISLHWQSFFTKDSTQRPIRLCRQHNTGDCFSQVALYFLARCHQCRRSLWQCCRCSVSVFDSNVRVGCRRLQHSNGNTSFHNNSRMQLVSASAQSQVSTQKKEPHSNHVCTLKHH